MRKRVLAIILALCLALTLLPATALAIEPSGEGWSYSSDTNILTISSGSGMYDVLSGGSLDEMEIETVEFTENVLLDKEGDFIFFPFPMVVRSGATLTIIRGELDTTCSFTVEEGGTLQLCGDNGSNGCFEIGVPDDFAYGDATSAAPCFTNHGTVNIDDDCELIICAPAAYQGNAPVCGNDNSGNGIFRYIELVSYQGLLNDGALYSCCDTAQESFYNRYAAFVNTESALRDAVTSPDRRYDTVIVGGLRSDDAVTLTHEGDFDPWNDQPTELVLDNCRFLLRCPLTIEAGVTLLNTNGSMIITLANIENGFANGSIVLDGGRLVTEGNRSALIVNPTGNGGDAFHIKNGGRCTCRYGAYAEFGNVRVEGKAPDMPDGQQEIFSRIANDGGNIVFSGSAVFENEGQMTNDNGGYTEVCDPMTITSGSGLGNYGGSTLIVGKNSQKDDDTAGSITMTGDLLNGEAGLFNIGRMELRDGATISVNAQPNQGGLFVNANELQILSGCITVNDGARLHNDGQIHFDDSSVIDLKSGSVMNNYSQLNLNTSSSLLKVDGTLENYGMINVGGDALTEVGAAGLCKNRGQLDLNGGKLTVAGQLENNGDIRNSGGAITLTGALNNVKRVENVGVFKLSGAAARLHNSGELRVGNSATYGNRGYHELSLADGATFDACVTDEPQIRFGWMNLDEQGNVMDMDMMDGLSESKGIRRDFSVFAGYDFNGSWQRLTEDQVAIELVPYYYYEIDGQREFYGADGAPFTASGTYDDGMNTYDLQPCDALRLTQEGESVHLEMLDWGRAGVKLSAVDVEGFTDVTDYAEVAVELPYVGFFYNYDYSEESAVYGEQINYMAGSTDLYYMCRDGFYQDEEAEIFIKAPGRDWERLEIEDGDAFFPWDEERTAIFYIDYLGWQTESGEMRRNMVIHFTENVPESDFDLKCHISGQWREITCRKPVLWVDDISPLRADDTFTAYIMADNLPGLAGFNLDLRYDSESLLLVGEDPVQFNGSLSGDNTKIRTDLKDCIRVSYATNDNVYDLYEENVGNYLFAVTFQVKSSGDNKNFSADIPLELRFAPDPENGQEDCGNVTSAVGNEELASVMPRLEGNTAHVYKWGDVYRDGSNDGWDRVNIKDAVRLAQLLTGNEKYNIQDYEYAAADVYRVDANQASVDIDDMICLLRYLAGYDDVKLGAVVETIH